MTKSYIIVNVTFFSRENGGLKGEIYYPINPDTGDKVTLGFPMITDEGNFECRLFDLPPLVPREVPIETTIRFLDPVRAFRHMKTGMKFKIWHGRIIAEGVVVSVHWDENDKALGLHDTRSQHEIQPPVYDHEVVFDAEKVSLLANNEILWTIYLEEIIFLAYERTKKNFISYDYCLTITSYDGRFRKSRGFSLKDKGARDFVSYFCRQKGLEEKKIPKYKKPELMILWNFHGDIDTTILMSYQYLAQTVELSWQDIQYGLQRNYINPDVAVSFAFDMSLNMSKVPDDLTTILYTNDKPEIASCVDRLAELEIQRSLEEKNRKWLYLCLNWVYEHRQNYYEPLEMVELVYDDFDRPEKIASLIGYLPSNEPSLGSYEANRSRRMARWYDYIYEERKIFSPKVT